MKRIIFVLILGILIQSCSNKETEIEVKPLLIEQLKNSYSNQNWFVPVKTAIDGLNYEQAIWKDSTDNHSIIEIVAHLIFWNERVLKTFKEEDLSEFKDKNEVTFNFGNEAAAWTNRVSKLDSIQVEWDNLIQNASMDQLAEWSSEVSNMAGHNAYHTGQVIYIRKRNGWWK